MLDKDGTEIVLVRTEGGPYPGTRFVRITELTPMWPLPQELDIPGEEKKYKMASCSPLDERAAAMPNVARGATYRWEGYEPEEND